MNECGSEGVEELLCFGRSRQGGALCPLYKGRSVKKIEVKYTNDKLSNKQLDVINGLLPLGAAWQYYLLLLLQCLSSSIDRIYGYTCFPFCFEKEGDDFLVHKKQHGLLALLESSY